MHNAKYIITINSEHKQRTFQVHALVQMRSPVEFDVYEITEGGLFEFDVDEFNESDAEKFNDILLEKLEHTKDEIRNESDHYYQMGMAVENEIDRRLGK